MNSLKKRALAILLSAVTLASSMMSTTSVFADELSNENGSIYADIKGVGGTVSIEESENKTSYYLDDNGEVKSRDTNNSESVAVSDNDNYNVQYDSEVGTTLTIKVIPDVGYKVSEYSTAIDGGDAQSSLTEDTVEYSSQVTVSGTNQYISVNFEEVKLDDNAVYSLPDVDFSSCRLLVGSENEELFTNCSNVLSSYEGVYLLQFESEEATKKAYISLLDRVDFVNVDTNDFSVADIENVESDAMSEEINPINELAKTEIEEVKESNVIAVIDTGSSERANVIERVSVLGDNVEDDNGHGDKMISKILSQDENAKIISIKAMDSNGKGTTSSVYAGLKYAIEKKVDIINMSFVGIANEDNTSIEELIKEAIKQGITVVGSAGNNGVDASEYIPGCIEKAYIIGASNADGERLDNSNYGDTVDYNVVANSTSEAAALFTGYLSKNNKAIDGINSNGLIFDTDYKAESKDDDEDKDPVKDNETVSEVEKLPVDTSKTAIVKYLFIDESKVTGDETIDKVMFGNSDIVLYQLESVMDLHKVDDNTYKVITDAPFVNGTATSKALDVCFANGNINGEVISNGVSYDYDSNIATISKDALTKDKNDFTNIQIQVLVASSLNAKATINVTVKSELGRILDSKKLSYNPFDFVGIDMDTDNDISLDDLKVYINNSSKNCVNEDLNLSDSLLLVGKYVGAVKSVDLVLPESFKSGFSVAKPAKGDASSSYTNANLIGYLENNMDVSSLKAGWTKKIDCMVVFTAGVYDVNVGTTLQGLESGYLPTDFAIGLPKSVDGIKNFTIYDSSNKASNWWDSSNKTLSKYNLGLGAYCRHVSCGYSFPNKASTRSCTLRVLNKTTSGNTTYITFGIETIEGVTSGGNGDSQTAGGIFKLAVRKTAIKLQMQKDSSVSGFGSYNREGARYSIYKDSSCKTPLKYNGNNAYIEIGEDGYGKLGNGKGTNNASGDKGTRFEGKNSGADIPIGTYYAKETTAPTSGQFEKGSKTQPINTSSKVYKFVQTYNTDKTVKVDSKNVPIYRAHYVVDGSNKGTPKDDPYINLQLKKISANPEITNGNTTCYSYEGAVYGVYTKRSLASDANYQNTKNQFGTITTDADGYGCYITSQLGFGTNTNDTDSVYKNKKSGSRVKVNEGDGWFVRELIAPKGYELDPTIYELKDSGKTSSKGCKIYRPNGNSNGVADEPGNDPVTVSIKKVDPYTGDIIRLSGAIFKLEYYGEELPSTYESSFELDTAQSGYTNPFGSKKPTRTWYIQTNQYGYADLDDDWYIKNDKYPSDELYKDDVLGTIVPYGTLVVSEAESPDPDKYQVSTLEYYRKVDEDGNIDTVKLEMEIPEPRTPELDTVAVDSKTKSHSAIISNSTSITDTITYVGLYPNKTYTMRGWVVEKSSKTAYSTASTKTFTSDSSGAGTISLTHTFASDGSAGKATLAGKSVVAFAEVYEGTTLSSSHLIASHKDVNDADQTVSFIANGEITTKADYDILYGKSVKHNHPNIMDESNTRLYDTVYGYGLVQGTYHLYTMVLEVKDGVLVREGTSIARPIHYNQQGGSKPYYDCTVTTDSTGSFTKEIEFNGDFYDSDGKSYVVYEFLSTDEIDLSECKTLNKDHTAYIWDYNKVYDIFMDALDEDSMIASHTSPTDSNQTINFKSPKITTEAYPYGDKNRDSAYISGSKNETTIIESVKMENLNKGINYCLKPYVYVVENGEKVLLDESIAQKVKVYNGSSLISTNSNGTPFILNSICDGEDYDYNVVADLNGAFTFSAVSETQTLTLKFDFSDCKEAIKGKTITFGEMLVTEGRTDYYNIAEHNTSYKDATTIDANQTVNFIEATVSTKAISDNTGTSYAYAIGDSITITDTVTMTGLIPGKSYSLSGSLVDESGKNISGSTKSGHFTATAETQTVDRVLTLKNPSNFVGKKVVAYEKLYYSGYMIASHTDIYDDDQTINVLDPTVTTVASTRKTTVEKSSTHANENVTCYDKVSITGLIKGKTYTLNTQLVNKDLSSEGVLELFSMRKASSTVGTCTLSEDGKTVSVVFTADDKTQDINFTYTSVNIGYGNANLVVIDDLIYDGNTIVSHKDLSNTDQTLEYIGMGDLVVHKSDSYSNVVLGGVGFQIYSIDDKGTETTDDDEETLLNKVFSTHGTSNTAGTYYCEDANAQNYTTLYTRSNETSGNLEKGSLYVYNIPVGKYRLVETNPLPGYEIDNPEGFVFEITGNESIYKNLQVDEYVTNTPIKVDASFIKTDDNTVESEIKTISGAGFTIYSNYDCTTVAKDFYKNVIPEVISNESGIITFPDLAYSKTKNTIYYIKETTTPEGYVPLDYKIVLTVDKAGNISYSKMSSSGSTTRITDTYKLYIDESHQYFASFTRIINKRGSVELNKIDENNQPLSGSKWQLYRVDKVEDATGNETTKDTLVVLDLTDEDGVYRCNDSTEGETVLSTNDLGKLKVKNLPLGDYYFQEVKSPEKKIYDSEGLVTEFRSYMPYGDKINFSLTAEKPDLTSETSDTESNGDSIVVKNNLSLLPNTGGFGNGLGYIAGISFLLIASIIFTLCGVRLKKKYKIF